MGVIFRRLGAGAADQSQIVSPLRRRSSAQRCERIHLAAKALTALGAFLIVAALTRAFGCGEAAFVLGVAAGLGGIALLGSNKRTHQEMLAAIEAKAMRRADLIDAIQWGSSAAEASVVLNSPSINPM